MIPKINLKTKKDDYGETIFPFENIFPKYDKELSPLITKRALDSWIKFISGEITLIPSNLIPTLILLEDQINKIEEDSYTKLLTYIFDKGIYSDNIAKKLFFKLHRLWDKNKYFTQLLNVDNWIKKNSSGDDLIKIWQDCTPILLEIDSPMNAAISFNNSSKNVWKNQPRYIERILEICKCYDIFCNKFYKKSLEEVVIKERGYNFFYLFMRNLFIIASKQMILADNFTKDFIFNIDNIENENLKNTYPLCYKVIKNMLSRENVINVLKKDLYLPYHNQLVNKYKDQFNNVDFSADFLERIEKVLMDIYNLYPIDYKNTLQKNLPERDFIYKIIESLVNEAWPKLKLCSKFIKDLRLRSQYPVYNKILGDIIRKNKQIWQQNKKDIENIYLQDIYKKYIPPLTEYKWDYQFIDLLNLIEGNFESYYFDETEKDLYTFFLNSLIYKIIELGETQVKLCDYTNFNSDIRLQEIDRLDISDNIKKIIKQKVDKISILTDYVCYFSDIGQFEILNSYAENLYKTIKPYLGNISERQNIDVKYKKAINAIHQYETTQRIFEFTNNDNIGQERREFWLSMRNSIDSIELINPMVIIKIKNHLVLESFAYSEACYYERNYFNNNNSFEYVKVAIRRLNRSLQKPYKVADEMGISRKNRIIHRENWQSWARYCLR